MTSEASLSATSSPASADGPSPCDSQAGPMTDLFGQALAPASPSAPRASSVAATMSATYGLRSSTSSASAALEQSLASRLPELLGTPGGITWQQTWKAKATPQRRRILAHTASGLLTSDSGCIGWPTPNAGPQNDGDTTWQQRREAMKLKHGNGNGFGLTLGQASTLAGWPTPMAGTPAQNGNSAAGNNDSSRKTVALASWPTPTRAQQGSGETPEARKARGFNPGLTLMDAACMAAWNTPQSRDYKGANLPGNELTHNSRPLNEQARLATPGPSSHGFSAATARPGQLTPAISLWLMGYAMAAWLLAAPSANPQPRSQKRKRSTASTASASCEGQAMPSSRTPRQRS